MKAITTIVIKDSFKTVASVTGRAMSADNISLAVGQQVIDIEQFLEKLLGYRIHISIVVDGD